MTATDDRVTVLSLLAGYTARTGWLIVADDGTSTHVEADGAVCEAIKASGGALARVVNLDRVWAT